MKKTRRRIFGVLMTALMVCLPAMQALAQSFDASVMDPVPILFPGDTLEGILTPVTLDGEPLDLGAEIPAAWTNQDESRVYSTALAENGSGSILLTLAGYELDVEGGASEAGDDSTGPVGGHYVNADGTVDTAEGEPTKDRAYYPAYTVPPARQLLHPCEAEGGRAEGRHGVRQMDGRDTLGRCRCRG